MQYSDANVNYSKKNRKFNLTEKKTDFKIELFEYQDQNIFEMYWLCKHIRIRTLYGLNSRSQV